MRLQHFIKPVRFWAGLLLFILAIPYPNGYAQCGWAYPSAGAEALALDAQGELWVTGRRSGQMQAWDGAELWRGNYRGRAIATLANGNVLVAGAFTDSLWFPNQTIPVPAQAQWVVFVMNPQRDLVWAAYGTEADSGVGIGSEITDAVVLPGGDILLSGYFRSDFIWGTDTLVSNGERDGFVAKITENGDLLWWKQIGGLQDDLLQSVAVDLAGNLYVTGSFRDSIVVDSVKLEALGVAGSIGTVMEDALVVSLNADGDLRWFLRAGASGSPTCTMRESGTRVRTLGSRVLVTGFVQPPAIFYTAQATIGSQFMWAPGASACAQQAFLAVYDTSGQLAWLRRVGGQPNSLITSGASIVPTADLAAFDFVGTVSGIFALQDSGSAFVSDTTNNLSADIFIARYDTSGVLLTHYLAGGTGADIARAAIRLPNGNLAISGLYNHTLQIGNRQLTSAVGSLNNPFVAVLSPDYQLFDFPFPDTVRLVCGETFAANHFQPSDASFIWSPSVGVSDTTAAGPVFAPPYTTTYTFLASSPGCTYTDTLHIEVEQLEYQLSFELSDTLLLPPPVAIKITNTSPVVPGIVYTWVISDGSVFDSQAELVNHIFQQPGTYDITLVGTNLLTGCADTLIKENAVTVQEPQVARTGLALAEFALAAYPVPTSGSLTLTGDFSAYQPATAAVYDVAGQLRAEFSLREPVHQVSLDLASGQYLLVVTNAKGQKQQLRLAIVR